MERTDGILRILRTEYVLSLDKGSDEPHSWQPVLRIFTQSDEQQLEDWKHSSSDALRHVISDASNNNSLRTLLNRARENARGAQDQITKEVWEQVNHVYHSVNQTVTDRQFDGQDALHLIDSMTEMVTLYKGVTSSTMPRSMGWSFMNLGKYTERCMITLDITDRYFREIGYDLRDPSDILYWRHLLLSLSGYELHLKSYRTSLHTRNVAEQVFFNRHFTRSIRYGLDKIGHYLQDVTETNTPAEKESLERLFGRLHSKIRYADLTEVESTGPERFIADLRHDLLQFTKLLTQVFFSYA
jgi:uncharacterized alpha-E superfamily protein